MRILEEKWQQYEVEKACRTDNINVMMKLLIEYL